MPRAQDVIHALQKKATPAKAKAQTWFFKTDKGQYGHGDVFWGITVPEQRVIAKQHRDLPLKELDALLKHPAHECRLTALLILVDQYHRADARVEDAIVKFYLAHTRFVNNWDLVDTSAAKIVGAYLLDHDRRILYKLVKSKNIWERRIAIIATQTFINHGEFTDTQKIALLLLKDSHDLIHKAVGWMLREMGKKSRPTLVRFLQKNAPRMPRTALRYAIEHFPPSERQKFLTLKRR